MIHYSIQLYPVVKGLFHKPWYKDSCILTNQYFDGSCHGPVSFFVADLLAWNPHANLRRAMTIFEKIDMVDAWMKWTVGTPKEPYPVVENHPNIYNLETPRPIIYKYL